MAPNLFDEAKACPHRIELLPSLLDFLPQISSEIEIKQESVVNEILKDRFFTETPLDMNGFVVKQPPVLVSKLFHIEKANRLLLDFEADFACSDATGQGRQNGHLTVVGSCDYDPKLEEASGVHLRRIGFSFTDDQGETQSNAVVMAFGVAALGKKTVHHRIKQPVKRDE